MDEGLAQQTYNESQNTTKHFYAGAKATPKKKPAIIKKRKG